LFYSSEFEELGIDIGNPIIVNQSTGTCVCLITPDAERTMRTCLAVASHLSPKHVEERLIKSSEWLFIEGYVFANPETGQPAIREAIRLAQQYGTKIAVTCSDAFVPQSIRRSLHAALEHTDLFFCNEGEACAVASASNGEEAFNKLKGKFPSLVVTNGPHGAFIRHDGVEAHVPSFPTEPKDLTGAGDMFAGAFLYGITHGVDPDQGRPSSRLSVPQGNQPGRCPPASRNRQFWEECLAL
jgi:sugar/nucleoside kinase (ribokinase family)